MIRKVLKDNLKRALEEAGHKDIEPEVPATTDPSFGDYYSSIALKLAKPDSSQKPQEVAKSLQAKLPKNEDIFSASVAPNSFINFKIAEKYLQNQVKEIIEAGPNFGRLEAGYGKKARVEFISANPTGPLHIGNARGGPIGDTIANVLEFAGYKVLREYLNNDRGNQVYELGKTLAVKADLIETSQDELTYKGEYTDELAKKVKKEIGSVGKLKEDQIIKKAGEIGTKLLYKDILNDALDIGIKFDLLVNESDLQKKLPSAFKLLESKNLLIKQDGATWFLLGRGFDETRDAVVVKSDGSYTYFGADIVYHKEKFESGYDLIIDVFGSNTSGHVPKLEALIKALGYDLNKFKAILYQFVRVKRRDEAVKMSKRVGNFVTAREVLDEVGKDAFRYFMLMHDP
ncbi:MAG: arginine--tRNA ligase, partial [Candidatus Woykebacteria bacterium RBG_16_43_9]